MTGIDCLCVLRALSEPTRLRLMRALMKESLSVNDVGRRLRVSQYNVSKHLRILREAGLLDVEKQGRVHRYAVSQQLRKHLSRNGNSLDLECCTFRFDKLPR